MQNLQNELIKLLKNEDNLVVNNLLNKNKIIEAALKVEPFLIKLLIKNVIFKKYFFEDVENVEVKLVGFGNAVVVAVAVAVLVDVAVDVSFVLGGSAVKDCTISSAFPANGL